MPALGAKQCRDPAIAVTSKLAGKIDDRFRKRRFIAGHFRNMPLRRASLAKHTAGPAFGYTPASPEHDARSADDGQRSEVSRRGLFQDELVERQIGDCLLEPGVLALKLL